MKRMRTRFRLLSLLLSIGVLTVAVLCAVRVMTESGVSPPALPQLGSLWGGEKTEQPPEAQPVESPGNLPSETNAGIPDTPPSETNTESPEAPASEANTVSPEAPSSGTNNENPEPPPTETPAEDSDYHLYGL